MITLLNYPALIDSGKDVITQLASKDKTFKAFVKKALPLLTDIMLPTVQDHEAFGPDTRGWFVIHYATQQMPTKCFLFTKIILSAETPLYRYHMTDNNVFNCLKSNSLKVGNSVSCGLDPIAAQSEQGLCSYLKANPEIITALGYSEDTPLSDIKVLYLTVYMG